MPGPAQPDPSEADALTKALELELKMKRAAWERSKSQRGTWRTLSILFLLLVVAGALLAWFFFAGQMRERNREDPAAVSDR